MPAADPALITEFFLNLILQAMHFPDSIDLARYRQIYPKVAEALECARREPTAGELAFLEKAAATMLPIGNVGPANLCFLAAVASAVGATRMLEIGTASGATSALLAAIAASNLAERNKPPAGILLTTIDKKSRCLFDDSKPIGFMNADLAPAKRCSPQCPGNAASATSTKTPRLMCRAKTCAALSLPTSAPSSHAPICPAPRLDSRSASCSTPKAPPSPPSGWRKTYRKA